VGNVFRFDRAAIATLKLHVRPTFAQKLSASAGLSALFVVVYGGCNWLTARRSGIGTINFDWERRIPFVPLMIGPYLSIDLFFVAAPFLCRTRIELVTFAKRISAAITTAGICFLVFPFRFAFARPHASGWLGAVFDGFRGLDQPYNLVPSLHITLCVLLVVIYARHTCGLLRIASNTWFTLIAASALLTYQHHVIDVITGFLLAAYCSWFFPEDRPQSAPTTNVRIGCYYTAGAFVLAACALLFWPLGALLLWPAVALAIVAAAYFQFGAFVFRKIDGVIPWSTLVVLGPCIAGQHISRWYYRRRCRAWDAVTPDVWIGAALNDSEAIAAIGEGVTAVLDVTAEFSAPPAFRAIAYHNIPILDLTAPQTDQLREMATFIGEHAKGGIVYVHCKIGYSRSAAAVASYLLLSGRAVDVEDALMTIRRARPSIVIRPEVLAALRALDRPSIFSSPSIMPAPTIEPATL
jgi:protein-tyrosine phosphatase